MDRLAIGQKYQIDRILSECSPEFRRRLLAMGFTPGTVFETERVAPLGDPVQIKLRGASLALRKKELALLECVEIA